MVRELQGISMTPFLIMVLAGYAAFVVVLGGVWLRDAYGGGGKAR